MIGCYIPEVEDWPCPYPSLGSPGNQAYDWCWQGCGCHGLVVAYYKMKTEEGGVALASVGCFCLKPILEKERERKRIVQ